MKIKILWWVSCYLLVGCNKAQEPSKTDTANAILVETLMPENMGGSGLQLNGRILLLNNKNVEEQGFVVTYRRENKSLDSIVFKAATPTESGNQTLIIDQLPASADGYTVKYYLKSNKLTYSGDRLTFEVMPVLITQQQEHFLASPDELVIQGDFRKVNDSYTAFFSSRNNYFNSVGFTLNAEKTTMTISVPPKIDHGTEMNFFLSAPNYSNTFLARGLVLSKVFPLKRYDYYYSEMIYFEREGSGYDSKYPLQIIIGDKAFPFLPYYYLSELLAKSTGEVHQIGYYNGIDTIIFPKPLTLHPTPADRFKFRQSKAHPASTIAVAARDLEHHIPYLEHPPEFGGKTAHLITNWGADDQLTIDEVPEGSYAVTFKNSIRDYTSIDKIAVEKLRVGEVLTKSMFVGETLRISGNFIKGVSYSIRTNVGEFPGNVMSDGILEVPVNQANGSEWEINKIGYRNARGGETWVDVLLKVSVKNATFEGFSPKVGTYSTEITLRGTGISGGMISISGNWVYPYEGGKDYVKISIPRYIFPGQHKIAIYYNHQWLTVDQSFDLQLF